MRPAPVLFAALLLLVACPGPDGEEETLYVSADAIASGDGSEARPFHTVTEALTAAGAMQDPLILVAPGTYPEALSWAVQAVTLAGHGGAPVIGDGATTAFTLEAGATVELRDMTVMGVSSTGSSLVLEDVTFSGLPLVSVSSDLDLVRVDSTGLQPTIAGGSLIARGLTLGGIEGDAALLTDVEAIISDATVSDVTAPVDGIAVGINVEGGRLFIQDSAFTDVATRGLRVAAGVAEVHDSTFTGIGLTSIAFSADADWIPSAGVVAGCEFTGNSTDVMVNASDVIVRDNYFTGTTTFAVSGSDGASVQVDRNHFEDLVGSAVTLIGPFTSNVTENLIEGGCDDGAISVQWSGAEVLVGWNEIREVSWSGISFSGVTDALVVYNTIEEVQLDPWFGTAAEGISMIDAAGDIYGNVITDVLGIGIDMHRMGGAVYDNTIVGSLGGGIRVDGVGQAPPLMITDNVSNENVGYGVIAMDADVVISGNELNHNDYNTDGFGDGVALMVDTVAEVTGNETRGNEANGIMAIDNVTATVSGNHVAGNDTYGIWVHCENDSIPIRPSNVVIGTNTYEDNWLTDLHGCYEEETR